MGLNTQIKDHMNITRIDDRPLYLYAYRRKSSGTSTQEFKAPYHVLFRRKYQSLSLKLLVVKCGQACVLDQSTFPSRSITLPPCI